MKTYRLSFADSTTHCPEHPERTAVKHGSGFGGDVTYKVWPSAGALQTSVGMQNRRSSRGDDWKPWVKTPTGQRLIESGRCPAPLARARRR